MDKLKKKRARGRECPNYALKDAIEMMRRIREQIGDHQCARDLLAEPLGYKSAKSGAFGTKVGTLCHFGLLDRAGNTYRASALAMQILVPRSSEEKASAIAEAAIRPALYADLFDEFDGKGLPGMLPNILSRQFRIVQAKAQAVTDVFRASMEFAGLLRNGVLRRTPHEGTEGTRDTTPSEGARATYPTPEEVPEDSTSAGEVLGQLNSFTIPLSKGRAGVLQLPRPLTQVDVQLLQGWINLMKEVLLENEAAATDGSDGSKD